jgi:hypothetical protein
MDADEFQESIRRINENTKPIKAKIHFNDRLFMFYMLFGLIALAVVGVILGIFVHYAIAIVLSVLYFGGLVFIIVRVKKINSSLLLSEFFNLCLVVKNENVNNYHQYGMKMRVGFLGKWLEIKFENKK